MESKSTNSTITMVALHGKLTCFFIAVVIVRLLLWVGVIIFSVLADIGGLVPLSVPVPPGHPHVRQHSNQSDSNIGHVVIKATADGQRPRHYCKWYDEKSSKNLVETFDGVE